METWIFLSAVSVALLYLIYRFLFTNLTFFSLNRLLILFIPLMSLTLPFLRIPPVVEISANYVLPVYETIRSEVALVPTREHLSYITLIYVLGLLVATSLLVIRLTRLLVFLNRKEFRKNGSVYVSLMSENLSSFSFFNFICIHENELDKELKIIRHEKLHFERGHSIDNLFYECLKCLMWFNPFIYLLHKELRNLHEYEVDSILGNENESEYAEDLSDHLVKFKEMSLTSSYKSKSNLLKRIQMLYKNRSSSWKKINYLSILPAILLLLIVVSCSNQQDVEIPQNPALEATENMQDQVVSGKELNNLTNMPQYNGGVEAMYAFLGENIEYPKEAKSKNLSGKVFVSFVVEKDGKISKAQVRKGIHPLLDNEALRVIQKMPDWIPGDKDGKKVSVEFMLPIQFTLASD